MLKDNFSSAFSYCQNINIEFGAGTADLIPSILEKNGFKRCVLVSGGTFIRNGIANKIKDSTQAIVGLVSGIKENPGLKDVEALNAALREHNADAIVAMGGGSVIDCAKFSSVTAFQDVSPSDVLNGKVAVPQNAIPLIAVPTTAGTGTEVTGVSVITDETTGIKKPVNDKALYAFCALLDPILTTSLSRYSTAVCGFDALSHALESMWSRGRNPVSDALSLSAVKLIFSNIEDAYTDGNDLCARSNMLLASLLAGLAFAPTRTAGVHACSYPLSIKYNMTHGEACAFTLDSFVKVNSRADGGRLNKFAIEAGFYGVEAMCAEIKRLKHLFGLKTTVKEAGITDIESLARECAAHPLMALNPIRLSADEVAAIFESLNRK